MTNKDQKLEQWAERELKRNIDSMIVADQQGGVVAFGKYLIQPTGQGYLVRTWADPIHEFGTKRAAISYCVADKNNRINLATQIRVLDTKQQILTNDLRCRQAQCNRARTQDFYDTVEAKIFPIASRLEAVTAELEKCVNTAKYIQIRGFHNETARTSGH